MHIKDDGAKEVQQHQKNSEVFEFDNRPTSYGNNHGTTQSQPTDLMGHDNSNSGNAFMNSFDMRHQIDLSIDPTR